MTDGLLFCSCNIPGKLDKMAQGTRSGVAAGHVTMTGIPPVRHREWTWWLASGVAGTHNNVKTHGRAALGVAPQPDAGV